MSNIGARQHELAVRFTALAEEAITTGTAGSIFTYEECYKNPETGAPIIALGLPPDDDHEPTATEKILNIARENLANYGWVELRADALSALGLGAGFNYELRHQFETPGLVVPHAWDTPAGRQRASDLSDYARTPEELLLAPHPDNQIVSAKDNPPYSRFSSLQSPRFCRFQGTQLQLAPKNRRQPRGTTGVHLFETGGVTQNKVVERPHHDFEDYIAIVGIEKVGDPQSACTELTPDASTGAFGNTEPIRANIGPNHALIFSDELLHYTSELEPIAAGNLTLRRVMIATVNRAANYQLPPDFNPMQVVAALRKYAE